jgi:hypothetical protein
MDHALVRSSLRRCLVARSDDTSEFFERDDETCSRSRAEFVVTSSNVLDECVAADDYAGGSVAFEASHRPKSSFESTVIALDPVVRILLGVVERVRDERLNRCLQRLG